MNIDWSKVKTAAKVESENSLAKYEAWKTERMALVNSITVEVDGMVFDGDEISQNRMARAVTASDTLTDVISWTLHDNSVVPVTAMQLKKACFLAGEEQTKIWNDGRP